MVTHPQFPPDPAVLRDSLRELRHVLRRGRDALGHTVSPGLLPRPAEHLVRKVIREVDHMAEGAEGLARRLLSHAPGALMEAERPAAPDGPTRAAYTALGAALTHLGARYALIREAALHQAFAGHALPDTPMAAAVLARRVVAEGAIRDIHLAPGAKGAPEDIAAQAVFALFLWLLAGDRDNGEADALEAAADIAAVLGGELRAAFADPEPRRLAGLIEEFRNHV